MMHVNRKDGLQFYWVFFKYRQSLVINIYTGALKALLIK